MVAGNTLGAIEPNTRFVLGNAALDNFHVFYSAVAIVQCGAMLGLLRRAGAYYRQHHEAGRYRGRRAAFTLAALLAGGLVAVGGGWLAFLHAPKMQHLFQSVFARYLTARSKRVVFPQEADLWRTVPHKAGSDRTIVLRVRAPRAPGYLRGRVYDVYDAGRWRGPKAKAPLPVVVPEGRVAFTLFQRPGYPVGETPRQLDVFPTSSFVGEILSAPGTTAEVEILADEIETDSNGTLFAADWDEAGGYTVRARPYTFVSPYPRPGRATGQESLTAVPESVREPLSELAAEVFGDVPDGDTHGAIRALTLHYHRGFSYALGERMRGGRDPVVQFLFDKRRGHCELFAAATALLLRTRGVPTRYVTGFVCAEPHPFGGYWTARLEDAHAWVEAFVAEDGEWILVETTPAGGVPASDSRYNWATALWDGLAALWRSILSALKRGYVAEAIFRAFAGFSRGVWWLFVHPVRGPSALLLTAVAGVQMWHRRRARAAARRRGLSPAARALQPHLQAIEHHLARHGIRRPSSGTLRELSAAVAGAHLPGSGEIVDVLAAYEALRYRAVPPDEAVVSAFAARAARVVRGD